MINAHFHRALRSAKFPYVSVGTVAGAKGGYTLTLTPRLRTPKKDGLRAAQYVRFPAFLASL